MSCTSQASSHGADALSDASAQPTQRIARRACSARAMHAAPGLSHPTRDLQACQLAAPQATPHAAHLQSLRYHVRLRGAGRRHCWPGVREGAAAAGRERLSDSTGARAGPLQRRNRRWARVRRCRSTARTNAGFRNASLPHPYAPALKCFRNVAVHHPCGRRTACVAAVHRRKCEALRLPPVGCVAGSCIASHFPARWQAASGWVPHTCLLHLQASGCAPLLTALRLLLKCVLAAPQRGKSTFAQCAFCIMSQPPQASAPCCHVGAACQCCFGMAAAAAQCGCPVSSAAY